MYEYYFSLGNYELKPIPHRYSLNSQCNSFASHMNLQYKRKHNQDRIYAHFYHQPNYQSIVPRRNGILKQCVTILSFHLFLRSKFSYSYFSINKNFSIRMKKHKIQSLRIRAIDWNDELRIRNA